MRTLIKGGTVVTATETTKADVVIEDERVSAIGVGMPVQADVEIDATDRYVMPGGVDVHTHMDLPFGGSFCSDNFETGTRAAAFGGTTTIVDFALQDYGEGLREGLDRWHEKAKLATTDYGFHMIIREVNDQVLGEMDELVGEGVTSFKLFMAYPGVFMLDDASIFRAMRQGADSGALIMMHAENGGSIDVLVRQFLDEGKTEPLSHGLTRPAMMEGEAVHRAFKLAELAGTPAYIVHLSSRDALNAVREARDRGLPAYAETPVPVSLPGRPRSPRVRGGQVRLLATAAPRRSPGGPVEGASGRRPPGRLDRPCAVQLRGAEGYGQGRLLEDPERSPLRRGPVHAPLWGVEAGHIGLNRFVEIVATAPAKMFGLYPRKGTIAPGSDADVVVFDPRVEREISAKTHHMYVDYSAYEGRKVRGLPEVVMQRGRVLVQDGAFHGRAGQGRFLQRSRIGLSSVRYVRPGPAR